MAGHRLAEGLLISQTAIILVLLSWFLSEGQANPFLSEWISQHFSYVSILMTYMLSEIVVFGLGAFLAGCVGFAVFQLEKANIAEPKPLRPSGSRLRGLPLQTTVSPVISAIGLAILGLGGIRGSLSLVVEGFGLVLWGTFLLPRRGFSRNVTLDNTALASITKTLELVMSNPTAQREPIYVPKRSEPGGLQVSLVIFREPTITPQSMTPARAGVGRIDFFPAPGERLLALVEERLRLDFANVPLSKLPELLKGAVVEKIKLAHDFEQSPAGPLFHFRVFGCLYSGVCGEISSVGHVASHIGCPFCSMIACALVKSSARQVSIESSIVSAGGEVMDITYRLLDTDAQDRQYGLETLASEKV